MIRMIPGLTAAALAFALGAQADDDPPGFNHPEFICFTDQSGRFVVLERLGNGPDRTGKITGPERNAYVTVFEYLGKGNPLRKLYEVKLLSKGVPGLMLSSDGRFLVSTDDMQTSGISPLTVVVYDLARKERSAYAGKDFLREETIRSLPHQGFKSGFKWCGKDHVFSKDNTRYYPTLPSNCKEEQVPFVVIDLRTRTVHEAPLPEVDPADIVPNSNKHWWWRESRDTIPVDGTILPLRIMRLSAPGVVDELFDLSPAKNEYIPVKEASPRQGGKREGTK